ncbi:RNA polymerase sigma-70 factor, ECF subfamily [Sinomicrobium oceani]|uniref:RNA polymerase sigma-70 factor, ECF subfamily n=1 Tax=Sinomicrobium oceani TaxID=1150368 RepID=A0A1K1Q3F8_9FLAO|nr:sigma-70 family RNA polymerase sigma factor [Sinomicrobium oceani]SFW54554.1 RNA polymerase sigma-70 factor, ECF subfamily [Sinomicrobium oceani]
MGAQTPYNELLPHLFRQEYAKMTAVLCRHFGLKHLETAEDIASDTFLKASEHWAVHGIPENPQAWLYTVAKNKARDYFRHRTVFETQVRDRLSPGEAEQVPVIVFDRHLIADSQLAMILAVCNPANARESQIALALQVLCGFSVAEIANAFLTKPETIKKRLQRARKNLREDNFRIEPLSETEVASRLDTVLKTLYLLFNEGYFSGTGNRLVRKELCSEAVRLALVLTEHPCTDTPQTNALLALMCFQSSRLEARTDDKGETILFEEQDRSLWDEALIRRGNYFLVNATNGGEVSRYHLEAAIAYWHTTPTDGDKWRYILTLYDQLVLLDASPLTAWNRIFALAMVHGKEKAIAEAEKTKATDSRFYHALLGFLYAGKDRDRAIAHYKQAIALTPSLPERMTLTKAIKRLKRT